MNMCGSYENCQRVLDFNIKLECDIKDEPLESSEHYPCIEKVLKSESEHQDEVPASDTENSSFLRPFGNGSVKIEDEISEDVYDPNKIADYYQIKVENLLEECVKNEDFDIKVKDIPIPTPKSYTDNEVFFHRLQESKFPKVVIRKLQIGNEKVLASITENSSQSKPGGSGSVKIKDEFNEDVYEQMKKAENHQINVENPLEEHIKKEEFDIESQDYIPKPNSHTDNEVFLRRLQESAFPKVVIRKLDIGIEEKNSLDIEEVFNQEQDSRESSKCFSSHSSQCGSLNHSNEGRIFKRNEIGLEECQKDCLFGTKLKESLECSKCKYKANSKGKLNDHLLTRTKRKLFKCSECDYETNGKRCLKIHLLNHSNTKLFKCSECDYGTNHKGDLKTHLLNHSNTKLFKCSKCDFGTNVKRYLKIHLLNHSNTKLFKCSECDYRTNQKCNLKTHLLSHSNTKLLKCSKCDFVTNYKSCLKSHLFNHSNTKLFKCSECDYGTNRKGNLKTHLLNHSNTKLFKCSECDFGTNQKDNLKTHLLSHSNTKLFKCSECDFGTNYKSRLKSHLLNHSNTKLFKCSECDYGTNHKGEIKIHLLNHSNTKLFKCSECDYGSNRKSNLKNHLLKHLDS